MLKKFLKRSTSTSGGNSGALLEDAPSFTLVSSSGRGFDLESCNWQRKPNHRWRLDKQGDLNIIFKSYINLLFTSFDPTPSNYISIFI